MVDDGDGAPLRGVTPGGVACRLGPGNEGAGDPLASAVRLSMGRFGAWPTTPATMTTARPQATIAASAGCDSVRRHTVGLRTRGWGSGIIASAPRLVAWPIGELAGMSARDRHRDWLAITRGRAFRAHELGRFVTSAINSAQASGARQCAHCASRRGVHRSAARGERTSPQGSARPGPAVEAFTWELPAGLLDQGTSAEQTCRRELIPGRERATRRGSAGRAPGAGAPRSGRSA
jgi:hypothetical protein